MCGRFVGFRRLEELQTYFPIEASDVHWMKNFNVAPTQEVLAILSERGINRLVRLHWGLVPFWAKDSAIGSKLINARSETVAAKPSFRNAFRKRRCLIPADGFYEWKGKNGDKQPVFLTLPNKEPFAFAGLWEAWDDRGRLAEPYRSCTILTRAASESMKPIHHRMPVILKPDAYNAWLDPNNHDVDALEEIVHHRIDTEVIGVPVSKQVNSIRNNRPENILPMEKD